MERIDYLGAKIGCWKVGDSTFLAWPEKGARLMNWHLQLADGSVRDIIHWPEADSTDDFALIRGGNPILFPFSARTFHQGSIHRWKAPDGQVRPMPMHGIARQGQFVLSSEDDHGFTAVYQPDEAALQAYPFDYEFSVAYRFRALALSVEFRLRNLGDVRLPWSAGHHFYFSVPWREGSRRRDYSVSVPARKAWRQDARGQLVAVEGYRSGVVRLDTPSLAYRIHTDLRSGNIRMNDEETGDGIRLRIGSGKKPTPDTAVVTWTSGPEAPFYCVEPRMGPPNSPESGMGLHWVDPGKSGVFSVEVILETD